MAKELKVGMAKELKVFKVTGWVQYKTDIATTIDRTQLAATAAEAEADATISWKDRPDYRVKVVAREI